MERKRELFKRYLEEKKVMDTLSRLVVSLYERPERPADALTYIRDFLAQDTGGVDVATVRQENVNLSKKLTELNLKLLDLERKAAQPKLSAREEEAPVEEQPAEEPAGEQT